MHLLCGSSRAMKRAHGGWQRQNSMALHREENKVPLRQSPKCRWMIAEDKLGQKIATTKGNVKAEKSEEWMARSPVWADDVIASETASRHQPMNWRDSIWVQTSVTEWAFPMRSTQRLVHLWKRTDLLAAQAACASKHLEKTLIVWFIFRNS